MTPLYDDRDEESLRRARRAKRMEQMRQEKKRREELNRRVRQLLPLAAIVVVIIVVVIVLAVVLGKSGEEKDIGQPGEGKSKQEAVQETETEKEQSGANDEDGGVVEPLSEESQGITPQADTTPTNTGTTTFYNFATTPDTATIYSEEIISSHAILIDESTDTIVASRGAMERISPASMTKVLTVLVAAEHITEEELDNTLTMTLEITDYAYVNDCSSVGFLDGEEVTVRDMFYGTTLHSGGDAAVGLATYVAGSHEAFVEMMNDKLDELGLSESAHFTNCVGLYDEEHYCTVYDMAVIMKAAMENELCREFLSLHTYTTTPTTEHPEGITISNWFLRRIEDKDTGGEVLCAKTGYVVQSKNCAVSYGTFAGGTPYICVTAGSSSSWRCIYDHVDIYNQYVRKE